MKKRKTDTQAIVVSGLSALALLCLLKKKKAVKIGSPDQSYMYYGKKYAICSTDEDGFMTPLRFTKTFPRAIAIVEKETQPYKKLGYEEKIIDKIDNKLKTYILTKGLKKIEYSIFYIK